mgnify:CR=1 FL=1
MRQHDENEKNAYENTIKINDQLYIKFPDIKKEPTTKEEKQKWKDEKCSK